MVILGTTGCNDNNNFFRNRIIYEIDNNYQTGIKLEINIADITEFYWDKMLIYSAGASYTGINEALGFEFKEDPNIFRGGIVFVYNSEVVFEDSVFFNPDRPPRFSYFVEHRFGTPRYAVFTPENAILIGRKRERRGSMHYSLIATIDPVN